MEEGHSITLTSWQNQDYLLILESPEGWLLLVCDRYEEKTEKSPWHVETLGMVSPFPLWSGLALRQKAGTVETERLGDKRGKKEQRKNEDKIRAAAT